MYYVFIDTNILLTFYSFTNEHLNKLKTIVELIKTKKIKLILTQQVYDEFIKNREKQIKVTIEFINEIKNVQKTSLTHHDFEEMKQIDAKFQEIKDLAKKLSAKIEPMIEKETLPADNVINDIFSIITTIPSSELLLSKARSRHERGLPPGKKHSYGDALNWELLLDIVPDEEGLYFIGADKDFSSLIDVNRIHPYLKKEWEHIKSSHIHYYFGSISKFLKEKFTELKISDEVIKTEVKTSGQVIQILGYQSSPTATALPYPAGGVYWDKINPEAPETRYIYTPWGPIPLDENGKPDYSKRPRVPWE